MLEAPAYLVSRELPSSCEQESKWLYNAMQVIELSNKRQLEDGEESVPKRAARSSESLERWEMMEDLNTVSIVQTDESDKKHEDEGLSLLSAVQTNQPYNHHQAEDHINLNSLVNQDGQEKEVGLCVFAIVQTDQPNNQHQAEGVLSLAIVQTDQPDNQVLADDLGSLIGPLGRDLSISCLLQCSRSDYGTIALLSKSFQTLVKGGLLYKLRQKMGIVEHWVYFSCNLLEWEAFDPIRHRWMHLPRMTSNECFMCSDKESLAVGTELLVFGKEITSHVIFRYSILTNSWTSGMKMNTPRCLFGSASLREIAILAGGCDPCGSVLDSAELYDSDAGTWDNIPSMNKARKMCSGVFMDGKFYVIGGIGEGNAVLTCGEVYDLNTKTWQVIPNMLPPRSGSPGTAAAEAPPLLAVVKDELYAADYAQQIVRKYNKEKNEWKTLGRLPDRADSMNGWGLAFRACGDRLVVIGGPRSLGEGMIELNSWVPNDGTPQWDLLASRPSGSFVYNCAVMGC